MSKKNKFTKWTSGMTLLASAPTLASWANPPRGGSNINIQIESKNKSAQAKPNSNVVSTKVLRGIVYTLGVLIVLPVLLYGGVLVYRKIELKKLESQLATTKNALEKAKLAYKNEIAKERNRLEDVVKKQKERVEEQEKIVNKAKSIQSQAPELYFALEEIYEHIEKHILVNPKEVTSKQKINEGEFEKKKDRLVELKNKIDSISGSLEMKEQFGEDYSKLLIDLSKYFKSCLSPEHDVYDFNLVLTTIRLIELKIVPTVNCIHDYGERLLAKKEDVLKNRKKGYECDKKELENFIKNPYSSDFDVQDLREKHDNLENEIKKKEDNFYNINIFSSEK